MFRGGKRHKKNKGAKSQFTINCSGKKKDKEKLNEAQMQHLLSQFKLNNPKKVQLVYDYRYY